MTEPIDRLPDGRLTEIIKEIENQDSFVRGLMLYSIRHQNIGDERLIPYVESCLKDTAPCRCSAVPFHYAETRFVAAYALMTLRKNIGNQDSVFLKNVIEPLEIGDLLVIADQKGIPREDYAADRIREEVSQLFSILHNRNLLPAHDLELKFNPRYGRTQPYGGHYFIPVSMTGQA